MHLQKMYPALFSPGQFDLIPGRDRMMKMGFRLNTVHAVWLAALLVLSVSAPVAADSQAPEHAKQAVLVTGASSGIGRAIASRLAEEGYEIIVHFGKNLDGAQTTCDEISRLGGRSRMLSFDVSDADICRQSM